MTTTPIDQATSDHLLHSTAADYDLNADFAAQIRADRATIAAATAIVSRYTSGRIAPTSERVEDVAELAQAQQDKFERTYHDGLTLREIAEMQARCDETASEAPTHDGMWK